MASDYVMNIVGNYTKGEELAKEFYKTQPDDYDFLYIVFHQDDDDASASFVSWDPFVMPHIGVGSKDWLDRADEFGRVDGGMPDKRVGMKDPSPKRLRGCALFPSNLTKLGVGMGPTIHETAHYWANHLKVPGIGTGTSHWEHAGVNGSLGGFDPSMLVDAATQGPLTSSTTKVNVAPYSPCTGGDGKAYGKLELYLMGLLPKEEVGDIIVLENAQMKMGVTPWEVTISGWKRVTMDDIVARHGEAKPLNQPEYRGAFILWTQAPASAEQIAWVERWARIFSGEEDGGDRLSFSKATGDRASMTTKLSVPA